ADRPPGARRRWPVRGLHQVPHRHHGSLRLRTRSGEDRRGLPLLPYAARVNQSADAPGQQRQLSLPPLSYAEHERSRGPACRTESRPDHQVSGVHHVPHADTWFQLRSGVLPVVEDMPMGCHKNLGAYSSGLAVVLACLFLMSTSFAQSSGQTPAPPPAGTPPASAGSPPSPGEGKEIGGFQVTQSIELGGRIAEVTGSQPMYDTLVNYQTGARILEQSLTMRSLTHDDIFDTLTFNSFGWGGDPEQAARLRVAKYHWYNFSFTYQKIQNY